MDKEKQMLLFLLSSTALRTLTDSFTFGILFVIALRYSGEATAALVNSLGLLLIFLLSPFIGKIIDQKILSVRLSGIIYSFTGIGMFLFLTSIDFRIVIFVNLMLFVVFNIPASIYLASTSSKIYKGKPASGYSLLASVNTLFYIIGTTIGAYLVQNNHELIWVMLKFSLSIFVGIILALAFKILEYNLQKTETPAINPQAQILSTTGKVIVSPSFMNLRLFKEFFISRIKAMNKSLVTFVVCIAIFTFARVFYLTTVAFQIYDIFEGDVFMYTLLINTAALTAFLVFPFGGKISDRFGSKNMFILALGLTPLYFLSFIVLSNKILLVILWSLPIGVFSEVSQIGIISHLTSEGERNSAIGLVTSATSLGSVLGSLALSYFVDKSNLHTLLYLQIFVPIILIPILIFNPKLKN